MAERRHIEPLAQARPIELVAQRKIFDGRARCGPVSHPLGEERRAEAATAGKHSRSLCFSLSYKWRLKRSGFEQLPSQSRSQRPLYTKPTRIPALKPSKFQPAKISRSVSLNQMIDVRPWSIRRLLLYCDGDLFVHLANAKSGGLLIGL